MTDSQCAVLHFDVKTMSARDAGGRESSSSNLPLIFDNLADAERYAKDKVAAMPTLGCRIYDRDGKVLATLADGQVTQRFHGQPAARRSLLWGMLLLLVGVGLISLDVRMGYRLIFGVFLGVRVLWTAAFKLIDGIGGWKRGAPG